MEGKSKTNGIREKLLWRRLVARMVAAWTYVWVGYFECVLWQLGSGLTFSFSRLRYEEKAFSAAKERYNVAC